MSISDKPLNLRTDQLLDVPAAAERLGCSERYVRRLIQERRIPFVRLGGTKIRFSLGELELWLEGERVTARRC